MLPVRRQQPGQRASVKNLTARCSRPERATQYLDYRSWLTGQEWATLSSIAIALLPRNVTTGQHLVSGLWTTKTLVIITLPEKDTPQRCENCLTTSLISYPSKVMLKIVLNRLSLKQSTSSLKSRPFSEQS
ncbi:hypothetical protein PoB_002153700 [Plakobranchus ocellatus]|uniref:Uncharacterized protein n=1 Tax=Plakobranchus ocellatus TaxID=259542 RepID=A0AAV3ZKG7_9GAST|nr:hypothetical protein PoB_002153700 [Plakobranchus ocellatus]